MHVMALRVFAVVDQAATQAGLVIHDAPEHRVTFSNCHSDPKRSDGMPNTGIYRCWRQRRDLS